MGLLPETGGAVNPQTGLFGHASSLIDRIERTRLSLIAIVLICLVLWGGQYALRGLWEPDEARYTYVAQEMAQTGHWAVPYRNGEWYAHKPPLMFWLIRSATIITGGDFNGISGRLPTLLGAILALWCLVRLTETWFDRRTAGWMFFITLTSALFWLKGGTGQIDMLLLGLEMVSLYAMFESDAGNSVILRVVAYLFAGFAVLAKGPVGLIVPMGIYLSARLAAGEGRLLLKPHWFWGIPLALVPPLAWLGGAWLSGAPAGYFRELLFDQNVGRAAGTFGGHYKPFYYYFEYIPVDFLPWTLFVPAVILFLKKNSSHRKPVLRLCGWIGFVVLFFSLCGGKRNLYILSVYPAAAVLTAHALQRMAGTSGRLIRAGGYGFMGLLAVMTLAWPISFFVPERPVNNLYLLPLSLCTGVSAWSLFRHWRRRGPDKGWFGWMIGSMLVLELVVGCILFPALDRIKVPMELAVRVQEMVPKDSPLLLYAMNGEIFAYYGNRRGKRIDDPGLLEAAMRDTGHGIAVFSAKNWKKVENRLGRWGSTVPFSMGSKHLVWLEYKTPEETGDVS